MIKLTKAALYSTKLALYHINSCNQIKSIALTTHSFLTRDAKIANRYITTSQVPMCFCVCFFKSNDLTNGWFDCETGQKTQLEIYFE